jgi:1-deoxy-D-xylulose-5-phosphate synthase
MDMLTPILDRIVDPSDIRRLDERDLERLSREVREEIISAASQTGGHFGAGLGVVELTVALHYVFNTPADRLIWDVSHQAYPHKLLTGRRQALRSIRKRGGLYGFTKRSESEYDPFGAAHSSTSISAGLGMAVARDLKGERNHVIAVIGDGAISGGMAYEAMNHAGAQGSRLIVIVNDNGMSIAPAVGALSRHLNDLKSETRPNKGNQNSSFFETLGFEHIGPVDGHDIAQLVHTLRALRNDKATTPVVIHVVTEKGKGHPFKKTDAEKYHAVAPFDLDTLEFAKPKAKIPSYTSVFASSLIDHARADEKIVAITASMPSGTGLDKFADVFPNRMFDVGIAEQHAVTFAAGMATEGLKPFCAIYSTFLQRGYDQVVHDVALQNLPVRFAIDRAGLVGQDGATHAGSFDLCYMSALPNMVVMAPSDAVELRRMVATAVAYDDGPIVFRYPRGDISGTDDATEQRPLDIGKGRIILEGQDVAIINLGARMTACFEAAFGLEQRGISTTLADARFAKPIDTDLIERLVTSHEVVVIVEEGSIGGFTSHVLHHLAVQNLLGRTKIVPITLPDRFIAHGSPAEQYQDAGLDAAGIMERIMASRPARRSGRPLHLKSASATIA